ncbi:MAG: transglycosylase family protein [Streptosporangiaceae bacterium]|nr:transglycosylase family protein [Streptosporangiaceae bacterium]
MAAALCMSPHAHAAELHAADAAVPPAAAAEAAPQPQAARLFAATRTVALQQQAPATYTVRPGDSLSAIAGRVYRNPDAWPVLYWANRHQIRWADVIVAGQVLQVPALPARIPAPPAQLGPSMVAPSAPTATADVVQPAVQAEQPAQYAPVQAAPVQAAPAASVASYSGAYPGGAFGACVVAAESGGNAQVMNATGHYGLYQFSASTWAAYGGNPADFGNASVAEQNQVFANALAEGGESNWSAYDGC